MARYTPAIPQADNATCPARSGMDHNLVQVRFRPEADPQVSPDVAREQSLVQQASPNASLVYRDRAEWFNLPDHDERFKAADMLVGREQLSCPLLSGPSTMRVWIKEGTTNACEKAQAGRDHREAA